MVRWTGEAAKGHPYWWDGAIAPDLPEVPPEKVDILVVGAGYTGLAAARVVHDCGASVAVVDAGQPGHGASTRNGGMFGAHPRLSWAVLAQRFGAHVADGIFDEARTSIEFVRDLITQEEIACDLQNTGRLSLAWTRKHFEAQAAVVDTVARKSRVPLRRVTRDTLGQEIATEQYFGGIVFEDHAAIHPRKLHDGLMNAALRRGVPVVPDCGVTGLSRVDGGFAVETARGSIRAKKLILATNGYTSKAFGWHQKRVFPLPSYLIATETLPENLLGHLAPGRRMMVETRARHSYFRLSPDGTRILFGGRASIRNIPLAEAGRRLHRTMSEVWPELEEARLAYVWTGNTGYSFNHMPHVGEDDGIHYAMGFSGSGTVMAPYLGSKAGWRAVGDPRGETAYAETRLKRNWLHPTGTPHFLHAADLWYRLWVDTLDSARRRH